MENQLTIRLPTDLTIKIRQKAKQLGLKRSDVVRMALNEFLEGPSENIPVYDRVKHLVGSVTTRIPDLGEKHREHLMRKLKKRA
jgi:antitoxin component of RelBE/YafQ-DinJ toxin-antitoxin module